MDDATTAGTGLLLLRAVLSGLLVAHATQKLFGWFSGGGLAAAGAGFERMGHRPGRPMAAIAGLSESFAALLLVTGAFFPLGLAAGIGTMTVAAVSLTRLHGSFWNVKGGGEYPALIAATLAALAFLGPGRFSLDAALDAPWHTADGSVATVIALVTVAVAGLAAAPVLLRRTASSPAIEV